MSLGKHKPGLTDLLRGYAEGRLDSTNYPETIEQLPTFVRMVVMDVVNDPYGEVDDKKLAGWSSIGVMNMTYARVLPRNTIIAKRVNVDGPPMFVFPFFPSHLSFPCKAGEMVWVMFEKPDAAISEMAYWFCRITEPHHVDDVNHSHPGRNFETSMFPSSKERFKNEKVGKSESGENVWHELRNGPVIKTGEGRGTVPTNAILRGESEDVFERLITETDASKLTVYEPVPRYRKRPGDVVLEGSNNSLIVLGTDRNGTVADYVSPPPGEDASLIKNSKVPTIPGEDFRESSGTIDMVVGRGQTDSTLGKIADTTSIKDAAAGKKGTTLKRELDKSPDSLEKNEGDPDLKNDRSRILISQRTSVDGNLRLSKYNSKFKITDEPKGEPAIVIKTDKLRLVARSDIEILVTNYDKGKSPDGLTRKDESDDFGKWASIVIKTNGDIVMKPSDKGFIKLGDETANKALLCTDLPAVTADGKVLPTTAALTNTMGGSFGGTQIPTQGTWAKKILVTGARDPDVPKSKRE